MKRCSDISRANQLLILNRLSFFRSFSATEKEYLIDKTRGFMHADQGEYIIRQQANDNAFYILLTGKAQVQLANHKIPVSDIEPGDFFGELSFLQNIPRTSNVIAMEQCILYRADRAILAGMNCVMREKFKDQIIKKLIDFVLNYNQCLERSLAAGELLRNQPAP